MNDGIHTDAWCANVSNNRPPVLALPGHSAPLGITFYDGDNCNATQVLWRETHSLHFMDRGIETYLLVTKSFAFLSRKIRAIRCRLDILKMCLDKLKPVNAVFRKGVMLYRLMQPERLFELERVQEIQMEVFRRRVEARIGWLTWC